MGTVRSVMGTVCSVTGTGGQRGGRPARCAQRSATAVPVTETINIEPFSPIVMFS